MKAPCYYHNYVLGKLLASQLEHRVARDVLKAKAGQPVSLAGDLRIGRYLRTSVFGPGSRYPWQEMIERATGEPLTAKYFVEQFIEPTP